MSKRISEFSEFPENSESWKICEFCNNKSRYYDFPPRGFITCNCEAPKQIHDECLFRKLDPITKSYYLNISDLVCDTCNSKILLNGTFYTYHKENGLLSSERNYKDSVLQGPYKEYSWDGETLIKEANYVSGKLQGLVNTWRIFNEGYYRKSEENYYNGILDGLSIYYYPDNIVKEKIIYKEGVIIGRYNDEA